MVSTRETPDTAASPADDTITVSAMPMVTAKSCSSTSGIINRFKSCLENNLSVSISIPAPLNP